METQEIIDILTAYNSGKTIQVKNKVCMMHADGTIKMSYVCELPNSDGWHDVPNAAVIQCIANHETLRVKPETKLRPYKNKEEFIKEQAQHGWYVLSPDEKECYLFQKVNDSGVRINSLVSFEGLMAEFKWYDGSPCGVLEEE